MNTAFKTPLLGFIEAGFPSSASEELRDSLSLDEYLLGSKEATYLLHVQSNSMKEAGILMGDMVIVERGKNPKAEDIVIVESEGSYSLAYFSKLAQDAGEVVVAAVVTAVVRKYGNF